MSLHPLLCLLSIVTLPAVAVGQESRPTSTPAPFFDERFDAWPVDLKIQGQVIAAPALTSELTLERLLPSKFSEKTGLVIAQASQWDALREMYEPLVDSVEMVGLSDASLENAADRGVDFIAWHDTRFCRDIPKSDLKRLKQSLQSHVSDGGTLIVVGPTCKILGRWYSDDPLSAHAKLEPGFSLFPDCVLHAEFDSFAEENEEQGGGKSRLPTAPQPRCVDIILEGNAALILSGRKLRIAGPGKATIEVGRNSVPQSLQFHSIEEATRGQRPNQWLIDLTQWRRRAIDLTLEPFPEAEPRQPYVDRGTLLIVGGGGMPEGLMDRFIELAGGTENAKLVYVPCSEADDVGEQQSMVRSWKKLGVENATFIHTKDRNKANQDPTLLEPLENATGIWFGGGRQWNFSDSYYGTQAHRLMKAALTRGGVIGGSSAGASIQARYLARATPIENFEIMAPGYERGGLGFISGVAIDQHFSQRGRQKDMTKLVDRYPQLLGIGIDETTAIIVQESTAEVVGKGKVHFYNRDEPTMPDEPDFIALEAGEKYDLASRRRIVE